MESIVVRTDVESCAHGRPMKLVLTQLMQVVASCGHVGFWAASAELVYEIDSA
jgi:hypothetical protein